MIYEKEPILQVLGSYIKQPSLLLDENYKTDINDFPERFYQIVFGAINNLYFSGSMALNAIVLDSYISQFPEQYAVFQANTGMEFIDRIEALAFVENFSANHTLMKKHTLLRTLQKKGFSIKSIWDESIVDPAKQEQRRKKLEEMSINEIIDQYNTIFSEVKSEFYRDRNQQGQSVDKGMRELKEELKLEPEIGLPMNSKIFDTIARGARRKKLYLRSAPSGYFKTRMMVADCCKVSVPYFYDLDKKEWVHTGFNESTLFIATELEIDECQTLFIAYVSGVDESHILDGKYYGDEEERVDKAIEYISKSKVFIERIPSFSIEDIERTIKRHSIINKITYCYFDYIFTSIKMITEIASQSRGMKLRGDNVLLVLIEKLKFLCGELDIHLSTSTQLSDNWKDAKVADNSLLRDAKSLAD